MAGEHQPEHPGGGGGVLRQPHGPQYGHVGLYIGNNQVIHAFSTVKQMSVDSIIACGYAWQGMGGGTAAPSPPEQERPCPAAGSMPPAALPWSPR